MKAFEDAYFKILAWLHTDFTPQSFGAEAMPRHLVPDDVQ